MKKYFYSDGKENHGPFTIEELQEKGIDSNTLIWYEGMEEWKPAGEMPELEGFVKAAPPSTTPSSSAVEPAGDFGEGKPPKTWLVESILVTLFCCLPFGIAGIVNASKVEARFYAGDIGGAKRASADAKKWTTVSFWIGLIGGILYFLLILAGAVSGGY